MRLRFPCMIVASLCCAASAVSAADVQVLTAGAMKEIVISIKPEFERRTGHSLIIANDTAGALARRIAAGESFDVAVITPAVIADLAAKGKIASGSSVVLARVGIGVMVKAGAPQPDISSVDSFKKTLSAARNVAIIDPQSGGSSGIYLVGLFDRLGITQQVMPKAKLKQGGHVADLIVAGEADIGLHQISEILPVSGVSLVGPLPAEIQNFTTYAGGVSASTPNAEAARIVLQLLAGPATDPILKAKGMERPPS